ncbi:MAG: murein biosynthesis integral membrane protein MurJ [Elusimicrobia bacterium]|nr:murein biosynthesis integral membrane protein MurJ [Elusimicrobiota bacterium]
MKAELTTNQKIAQASAVLIIASVLGHVLSLGKEILVANYFGITKAMDAFYAAVTIPNMINSMLITVFAAVFIPVFIEHRVKNINEANDLASITVTYLMLIFTVFALIIFASSPLIIKYGFHGLSSDVAGLAVKLLKILSFSLILSGLVGIITGLMNSFERFFLPSFSQMFVTIATILFILVFAKTHGVFVLAYGLLAGLLLQIVVLIPAVRKQGFLFRVNFNARHPAIKGILLSSGLFFAAAAINQLNIAVDRIMASYLDSGSIAALSYALKLGQVPLIMFSSSIAIAVFPFFARQAAENKIEELRDALSKSVRMAGFIFIPLTVISVILAKPLIRLLFQRGAFTSEDTELTAVIFICYSFQFFFYTVSNIFGKVILSFKNFAILFKITLFAVLANILLNFVFIKIVRPPVAGIALSTSFVYFIVMLMIGWFLKKKMLYLKSLYVVKGLISISIAVGFAAIASMRMFKFFDNVVFATAVFGNIFYIVSVSAIYMLVFLFICRLLKLEEPEKIMDVIKVKLGKEKYA